KCSRSLVTGLVICLPYTSTCVLPFLAAQGNPVPAGAASHLLVRGKIARAGCLHARCALGTRNGPPEQRAFPISVLCGVRGYQHAALCIFPQLVAHCPDRDA